MLGCPAHAPTSIELIGFALRSILCTPDSPAKVPLSIAVRLLKPKYKCVRYDIPRKASGLMLEGVVKAWESLIEPQSYSSDSSKSNKSGSSDSSESCKPTESPDTSKSPGTRRVHWLDPSHAQKTYLGCLQYGGSPPPATHRRLRLLSCQAFMNA